MQRGKENDKANFNKLLWKIRKERDEFGTMEMKATTTLTTTLTTTTTTTITTTTMIIRVILNKKL